MSASFLDIAPNNGRDKEGLSRKQSEMPLSHVVAGGGRHSEIMDKHPALVGTMDGLGLDEVVRLPELASVGRSVWESRSDWKASNTGGP